MMGLHLENLIEVEELFEISANGSSKDILNVNLFALGLVCDNNGFRESLNSASYLHFDGIGASIAFKLVAGVWVKPAGYKDWAPSFLETRPSGTKLMVIGGTPEESVAFARKIEITMPHLNIKTVDGYRGQQLILDQYNEEKPDICFVGMGMPKQEFFIKKLKEQNHKNLLFACGGWIKQFGGLESESPLLFRSLGLEWLYRSMLRKGHFRGRVLWPIGKVCKHYISRFL